MNLAKLSYSYIRKRPLGTILNVLLLALGIATIVVLLLFTRQFEDNLTRNAEGVDLVVGAKGSPLQLILSSIYHMDSPTGNIKVSDAQTVMQNRAVQQALPLALGDNYRGYRIVGATHDYAAHYGAELVEGDLWGAPHTVTIGARVAREQNLSIGDELVSAHGLAAEGSEHPEHPLHVVGIFGPTGTVVDRILLTAIETVWEVHEKPKAEGEEAEGDGPPAARRPGPPRPMPGAMMMPTNTEPEYTALLVRYASPVAAMMFPRFINSQTNMQAASPARETTRLLSLLGVGIDAFRAFGFILVIAAALGVFIGLYNALKERRYDLAIMRTLGAPRRKLLWHVLIEGILLALMGTALGLVLGHLAAEGLGVWVSQAQQMEMTGWTFLLEEGWLILLALVVGAVAAVIPAIQAYRTDIATVLAEG